MKKIPDEVQMLFISLFPCWTKEKASATPKPSGVSDDTYEDAMKGIITILFPIYFCKMCKYFCLNEFFILHILTCSRKKAFLN